MRRLLLIDGSNMMFRAYHATAHSGDLMRNSKGEYTNAVFALANMLMPYANGEYTHVLVAFDKGKKTYRHKTFPQYKAQRKAMPDPFKSQLTRIREIVERLGFFHIESETYEADDIIGTVAKRYGDRFDLVEIVTNDRDLHQILDKNIVQIMAAGRGAPSRRYTLSDLTNDTGLKPGQIPDLKGLMGDASDNIPGIPGVGEKTALKLLREYGTMENIFNHSFELTGKLKTRIEGHRKDAELAKRLATIDTDAVLDVTAEDFAYDGFDERVLLEFYREMEFHSLIKRLTLKPGSSAATVTNDCDVVFIENDDALSDYLTDETSLMLESFGDNYHHAEALGFVLHNDKGTAYIDYRNAIKHHDFLAFLRDAARRKRTFDGKRLQVLLMRDGIELAGIDFDLLLAAYILNPSHAKDDFRIVAQHFGVDDVPYHEEVYGKGAKAAIPDRGRIADYGAKKAKALKTIFPMALKMLKDRKQAELLHDVEMPLAATLARMEYRGIAVDRAALDAFDETLEKEISEITEIIHDLAGETFNIASPRQLSVILFEKLNLPSYKKSQTGHSTNIEVLTKLKGKHPIVEHVIRYRTLTKLQSTYVNGLRDAIQSDGKIHTIYKQALTQTGRLSSIEPNLQNIPIRTELGRNIRKVFIPEPEHVMLAADYSQIELRVLAHMADEKEMIRAFANEEDIHTRTARELFGKETVKRADRRIAKAVNFGIIYGQSAWGLAEELNVSVKEAETFINTYYRRFPGIATFMDRVIENAKTDGYVETMFGRRRYIPELESRIFNQRELGKRTAMNAPIQGTAADIIKIAMVRLDAAMRERNMTSSLLLQIHDELVFSLAPSETEAMKELVRTTMESAVKLDGVPLCVDLSTGSNLDDAK